MTNAVLEEACREPRPMPSLAKKTEADEKQTAPEEKGVEENAAVPLDHPEANYLLLPLSVPLDIVTSPVQLIFLLLWWKD